MKRIIYLLTLLITKAALAQLDSSYLSRSDEPKVYNTLIGETYQRDEEAEGWRERNESGWGYRVYSNPYYIYDCVQKQKTKDNAFKYYRYKNGKLYSGKVAEDCGWGNGYFVGNCVNGLLQGKGTFYFSDEEFPKDISVLSVKSEGQFADGEIVGKWVNYRSNGFVKEELYYLKGKEYPEKIVSYHDNNEIESIAEFKDDMLQSYNKFYDEKGTLVSTDSLVTIEKYSLATNDISLVYKTIKYFPNEKINSEGYIRIHPPLSDEIGIWKWYDINGEKIKEKNLGAYK